LVQLVIESSDSDDWFNAVREWEILDCEEDADMLSSCLCGKENYGASVELYVFANKKQSGGLNYEI